MSGPLLAVLDQGSSATKAALVSPHGELASARIAVATRHQGDHVEQDPREIWASVEGALGELEGAGRSDGLGLCAQRSSCLLWERHGGEPLTPVLSWQDRRHAAFADQLGAAQGERVREASGLLLSPHYAALKLRGLLAGDPALRARAARGEVVAGTLDAWLVQRLTGVPSTEPGQAGRTLLYDLAADDWSDELCEIFGVPRAALPALMPSLGERGRWRGRPLLALLGDQQAALLGHGGWEAGVVAAHVGSGAFVLASTGPELRRHRGLLSAVLAARTGERRFQIEGTVQSAGTAVDWVARLTGVEPAAVASTPLEPELLPVVVPAFVGLGAPWWQPRARAGVLGLDLGTDGEALVRATLLGIAHRLADNLDAMREAGVPVDHLRLSGGLAQRPDFAQAVCEVGRVEVEVAPGETGLGGVARGALLALGGEPLAVVASAASTRCAPGWSAPRWREARAAWRAGLRGVAS